MGCHRARRAGGTARPQAQRLGSGLEAWHGPRVRDPRKAPDPRSPVQPGRSGAGTYIVLAILGIAAIWAVHDVWIDPFALPYGTASKEGASTESAARDRPPGGHPAEGNLQSLFTADDYPVEALRNDEQGTVTAQLRIDRTGRVSGCTVAASSGSASLDRTTCEILRRRARFAPGTDSSGRPVSDAYTQRIIWRLE